MRWLLTIIGLAAALLAALFFVPAKEGKPLLDMSEVQQQWSSAQHQLVEGEQRADRDFEGKALQEQELADQMYRWKDANGNWQFGDVPPQGVEAELIGVKKLKSMSEQPGK